MLGARHKDVLLRVLWRTKGKSAAEGAWSSVRLFSRENMAVAVIIYRGREVLQLAMCK
jgi:hypothetical protein